ncbi:primase-helicase family protein [Consotaella aegiceratis]|uniref:primase-helicase family protein n=1 Tax=Consotaella aegiceratis TaxID=3097961 RepID=UPI002F405259
MRRLLAGERSGSIIVQFSGARAPRSALRLGDYQVDAMNAEFALVAVGKDVVIVWFRPDAAKDEEIRFLSLGAFRALSENARHWYFDDKGKERSIRYADKWMADPARREYSGIEFWPSSDGKLGRPGFLNLWRGFAVEPSERGSYAIFRDHLLTNVCDGDEAAFRWLFAWFASIIQKPREKPGTAIVLRGGMGVGKTMVGQIFGSLIESHYILADDARYLTGNFNAHMASCLLLQVDEGFWAGDKAAEGRLKGLVTSTTQMIEHKGVDPVKVDNHLRLMISSNSGWVVPAGRDERRFAIFDVAPHCAQNHEYFGELRQEIETGGRERLLHDLQHFDLGSINLREIPKSAGLLEQKVHSFDPIETWWFDRLQDGEPTRGHGLWPEFVRSRDLFDDYLAATERIGIRRKSAEAEFFMKWVKLLPEARKVRRMVPADRGTAVTRAWGYELPALDRARTVFEEALGQAVQWAADD